MFSIKRVKGILMVCAAASLSVVSGCQGFFDDVIASVTVTPSAVVLAVGENITFAASARMSTGLEKDVTASAQWSSSAPIAVVDKTGKVTATATGIAKIKAASNNVGGDSWLVVARSRLVSIEVTPVDRTLTLGSGEVQYRAAGIFEDGSTRDLTAYVRWRSSDQAVSTISSAGVAVPAGSGKTTISASISTSAGVGSDSTHFTVD